MVFRETVNSVAARYLSMEAVQAVSVVAVTVPVIGGAEHLIHSRRLVNCKELCRFVHGTVTG
jgi:hypothetical protein